MNFHLSREDLVNHANSKTCSYCGEVFDSPRALGGHLRSHRGDLTLRALNFHGRSHNSIDYNGHPAASLPNGQQSSAGANDTTPINRAPPPIDFDSNPRVSQTWILMCPNGGTSYHNSSTLGAFDAAFGDALEMTQGYNFCRPQFSSAGQSERSLSTCGSKKPYLATNPVNGDMIKELPLLNNFVGSISALESSDRAEEEIRADLDLSLRLMNEPKKSKISSGALVEPEIKELPLLNNFVESICALETCDAAEEEGPADLDLSLHL